MRGLRGRPLGTVVTVTDSESEPTKWKIFGERLDGAIKVAIKP